MHIERQLPFEYAASAHHPKRAWSIGVRMLSGSSQSPHQLLDLAGQKWPDLRDGETRLLIAVQRGAVAVFADDTASGVIASRETKAPDAAAWTDDRRRLSIELIRWLCVDDEARKHVAPRGIQMRSARIDRFRSADDADLDLSFIDIPFPLVFWQCLFDTDLDLCYATLPALSLRGSCARTVYAPHLSLKGRLMLDRGFVALSGVDLRGSRIGGDLVADGGAFHAPDRTGFERSDSLSRRLDDVAINLEGARVDGGVLLRRLRTAADAATNQPLLRTGAYFHSVGGVRLLGCAMRDLECDGAIVSARGLRPAIDGSRMRVSGNVHLRENFSSEGEVRIQLASIGGALDCNGANFKTSRTTGPSVGNEAMESAGQPERSGVSLRAVSATVGGSAFFIGTSADGWLEFQTATVNGDLVCDGLRFATDGVDPAAAALGANLARVTVKGVLRWVHIPTKPNVCLWLDDADVGRLVDDEGSWPANGNLSLAGLRYSAVSRPLDYARRRRWLRLQHPGRFSLQPHEQLAAVLRAAGHESDAKRISIDRENMRRRHEGLEVGRVVRRLWRRVSNNPKQVPPGGLPIRSWLWNQTIRSTIGYGYAPGRILWWFLGIIVAGTLVVGYARNRNSCVFVPADQGSVTCDPASNRVSKGQQPFNAFAYAVDTFLPIGDLNQENRWVPNPAESCVVIGTAQYPCGAILRYYLWAHTFAGWALTTLAVAGLTGLIRKA